MDPGTISLLIGGGSALGSFAGNIFGSNLSLRRQKQLMEHQAALNYQYGKLTAENSPTWSRQGLESAGYNPMLAVQNATSGVNSNFASQSTSQEPDYGASIANATEIARLKNESEQTESTVKLNEASARNSIQDSISKEIHNKYLDEREQKELGQIGAETDKLIRETSYYDQLAENMRARLELDQYLGEMGLAVQMRGQNISYNATKYASDKSYDASKYASDKSYDASKYATDNNMIKAGIAGLAGGIGLLYGPAKLKALRLLGKTKALGF